MAKKEQMLSKGWGKTKAAKRKGSFGHGKKGGMKKIEQALGRELASVRSLDGRRRKTAEKHPQNDIWGGKPYEKRAAVNSPIRRRLFLSQMTLVGR